MLTQLLLNYYSDITQFSYSDLVGMSGSCNAKHVTHLMVSKWNLKSNIRLIKYSNLYPMHIGQSLLVSAFPSLSVPLPKAGAGPTTELRPLSAPLGMFLLYIISNQLSFPSPPWEGILLEELWLWRRHALRTASHNYKKVLISTRDILENLAMYVD